MQREYVVPKDATILRGAAGEPAVEIKLSELRVGDPVAVRVAGDQVIVLRVRYKTLNGKLEAVARGTFLLDTGETFKATSETKIVLIVPPDDERHELALEDITIIRQGSAVKAVVNSDNRAVQVEVTESE